MSKTVVLELKGNLEQQGFYITLHIAQDGAAFGMTEDSYLPPSAALLRSLTQWQEDYRRLAFPTRAIKPYKLKFDGKIHPLEACVESAQQLAQQFTRWLRSESFRDIELRICQALMPDDSIRVLIRSPNSKIQALPWHLWELMEQYSKAEIVFVGSRSQIAGHDPPVRQLKQTHVNILAVLGDNRNIDVEHDRYLLNQLPGANVEFLVKPTHQEFHNYLYEKRWNILFFAGHSETETDGQGIIRLNSETDLTVAEVSYAVRRAIANGLQLAIFNSCDGLGLAHALADLQLPHMMIMREVVPDLVAQQFLKFFLQPFAHGQPLHLAAREARERLQSMEKQYPCASWLPIIYQQAAAPSLRWSDFLKQENGSRTGVQNDSDRPGRLPAQKPFHRASTVKKLITALVCGVLISGMMLGIRSLGWLEGLELQAFDHLMRLRPGQSVADDRILIVSVGEEDIQYQRNQGMEMEGSLSDEALFGLLQKITPYQPIVIGLDIIHDFPFSTEIRSDLSQVNELIGICQSRNSFSSIPGIAPSSHDIPVEQLGFNNVPLDRDHVIRRQFLGMPSDQVCPTEQSFNFRIAQQYLKETVGASLKWVTPSNGKASQILLGTQLFKRFERNAGGYRLPPGEDGGYQVLVNYRKADPEQFSLREILSGALDSQLAELVRDRIILIGVVNPQVDTHLTPYGTGHNPKQMPGVVVQAHMLSQTISAALNERPLLSWWTEGEEILWIGGWAFIGSGIVIVWRSLPGRVIGILTSFILLYSLCLLLLVQGWWVPFVPAAIAFGFTAIFTLGLYNFYNANRI